jgi:hypothetical protein
VEVEVYADTVKIQVTEIEHFRQAAIDRLMADGVLELPLVSSPVQATRL